MLAHGLTSDRSTLTPALDALKADNVDSDGDGVSDIDELIGRYRSQHERRRLAVAKRPFVWLRGGIPVRRPPAHLAVGASVVGVLVLLRRLRRLRGLPSPTNSADRFPTQTGL